jgi:adenylosuccinate lyase
MCGLARVLRGFAHTGLENVALWHERDISHSSAERVILPDACLTLHYMLVRFADVAEGLVVDTTRMRENLAATRGLVYSQAVLLALVKRGIAREEAYRIVQRNAAVAWDEGFELRDLLAKDREVTLTEAELDECFAPDRFLRHADVVFERLKALSLHP